MYDTGLADRIRARGVEVVEIAGWQTRGSSSFNPKGSVHHHTAGPASGVAPSLAICTYGRRDLAGPLCNVLQGRDDVAYVIAAGRANHAGKGGWKGLTGNSSVYGLEVEHTGHGAVPRRRHEISIQIHAAFAEGPTMPRDPGLVCQHSEWAPNRKIDFRSLEPFTPDLFRVAVAEALNHQEDPFMALSDSEQARLLRRVDWLYEKNGHPGPLDHLANNERSVVERRVSAIYLALVLGDKPAVDAAEVADLLRPTIRDAIAKIGAGASADELADELGRRLLG